MRELTRERFPNTIRNVYVQVGTGPIIAHYKGHKLLTVDITAQVPRGNDPLRKELRAARYHCLETSAEYVVHIFPNQAREYVCAAVWAQTEDALTPFYERDPETLLPTVLLDPVDAPYEEMTRQEQLQERLSRDMS